MHGAITLVNKLKRKDSITKLDVWYKTVINNCAYNTNKVQNISGNVVSVGQTFTILIPFTNKYLPYDKWKKSDNISNLFTLSVGDYIFLENISNENITPENIQNIRNNYEPNVCEIKSIMEVEKFNQTLFQFKIEGA